MVPLPQFLHELGGSGMGCVDTVLSELNERGYAHHIQRLMVLTNLGLMAGWNPQDSPVGSKPNLWMPITG